MKYLSQYLTVSVLLGSAAMFGCNTTRNDVTAARDKTAAEQRKLDEAKRDEARTVNKPVVEDNTARNREAERAHDKVIKQEERVREAQKEEVRKEENLNTEQSRDKFLIDCKASIDLTNRQIEKLQTERNAATEDGKKDIDQRIADIKAKRDALQSEINNIRTSDVKRWMDFHPAAQKAMNDLNQESKRVS